MPPWLLKILKATANVSHSAHDAFVKGLSDHALVHVNLMLPKRTKQGSAINSLLGYPHMVPNIQLRALNTIIKDVAAQAR
eukprot:11948395-Karenia_brevis.AAC.2